MADINLIRSAEINYLAKAGDSFAPPPVSFLIDGNPESFSGCSLKMQIRDFGNEIMKEITNGSGISIAANVVQYTIGATDMSEIKPGRYYYDVQKTDGSGIVSTIQHGGLTIKTDTTR